MSGILFLKTRKLQELKEFYVNKLSCDIWLEQVDCIIFRHGNFIFGFCERDVAEIEAMLTFFYDTRENVDKMYNALKPIAISSPVENDKYNIYQFFANDPEGRTIEFQYFNKPVINYLHGDQLLMSRRSIRKFTNENIPDKTLQTIVELSRYAPTAHNSQPYYFKYIYDRDTLDWLVDFKGRNARPIGRARMAVAICADPEISERYIQDGCIAAYHFMLAAWFHGLGTCWIADMDKDEVKNKLSIPQNHYLVTVTPLGFPQEHTVDIPERNEWKEFVKE